MELHGYGVGTGVTCGPAVLVAPAPAAPEDAPLTVAADVEQRRARAACAAVAAQLRAWAQDASAQDAAAQDAPAQDAPAPTPQPDTAPAPTPVPPESSTQTPPSAPQPQNLVELPAPAPQPDTPAPTPQPNTTPTPTPVPPESSTQTPPSTPQPQNLVELPKPTPQPDTPTPTPQPDTLAAILEAQALLASDPTALARIDARILSGKTAARAVYEVFADFAEALLVGPHADRAADIHDVALRICAHLSGTPLTGPPDLREPSILVADDLAPADTARLRLEYVRAFVTRRGSPNSHTSILAAQRGIPAVVACAEAGTIRAGARVVVDAGGGRVIVDPAEPCSCDGARDDAAPAPQDAVARHDSKDAAAPQDAVAPGSAQRPREKGERAGSGVPSSPACSPVPPDSGSETLLGGSQPQNLVELTQQQSATSKEPLSNLAAPTSAQPTLTLPQSAQPTSTLPQPAQPNQRQPKLSQPATPPIPVFVNVTSVADAWAASPETSTVPGAANPDSEPTIPAVAAIARTSAAPGAVGTNAAGAAAGVGLLRTELLLLGHRTPPSFADQVRSYAATMRPFARRPFTARLYDAGADKPLTFLPTPTPAPAEENPALGVRGWRLLRAYPDILRTQLRALVAAAADTGVVLHVLAPMIADPAEAAEFAAIARREGAERVGAMIEAPAAALLTAGILRYCDFVSIGTNDLTQFTLAADRTNPALAGYQDAWHPAVLRLVAEVVRQASGKDVGVCGQAAADPELAVVLFGLGVSSVSVPPPTLAAVRASLAGCSRDEAARLAAAALEGETAQDARARFRAQLTAGAQTGAWQTGAWQADAHPPSPHQPSARPPRARDDGART